MKLVKVNDKKICLINKNNKFYAIQDLCPHMGHPLHLGNLNPFNEIICALHTYRFKLSNGEESEGRCKSARIYEVTQEQDGIYLII